MVKAAGRVAESQLFRGLGWMATRTQTTMATCAWNRMGRVAQPKRCILGLTLVQWAAQGYNRAASTANRGRSGMLCGWSIGVSCGLRRTLQGARVWATACFTMVI